jgi:trehalose 2-sulfotransferase
VFGNNFTINYLEEKMRQHTSYIICANPRSGSFLLCEALKNTGLAGHPEEYFWHGQSIWKDRWESIPYENYLAWVFEQGTTTNGVFGTKVMWGYFHDFVSKLQSIPAYTELTPPTLLSEVFPNLHYIWITRQDKVRQGVSHWKAIQTQIWAQSKGEQPVPVLAKEPVFNFEAIDALIQEIVKHEAAWQHYFDAYGIKPFRVIYEELIPTYEETALQILRYLDIPYPENLIFAERRMQQQADAISEEWVQRYHQLRGSNI